MFNSSTKRAIMPEANITASTKFNAARMGAAIILNEKMNRSSTRTKARIDDVSRSFIE